VPLTHIELGVEVQQIFGDLASLCVKID